MTHEVDAGRIVGPGGNPMNAKILLFLLCALGIGIAVMAGLSSQRVQSEEAKGPETPVPVTPAPTVQPKEGTPMPAKTYAKPSDDDLKKNLSSIQYQVTQRNGTEPPFHNIYWDNHEDGIYVDVASGEPLFSSKDKFNSGTGWPSFTKPIEKDRVIEKTDEAHGMVRTEVRSKVGDSHLGHVFNDGPKEAGGMRYCINSASLKFIPLKSLEQEGYAPYKKVFEGPAVTLSLTGAQNNICTTPADGKKPGCEATMEVTYLAGGCFWGMQDLIRKIPGVISTEVGYTGGTTEKPTYPQVHAGMGGHAEAVKVIFDPTKLTYADLLEKWFFKMHDPTTLNRQGNDKGVSYRSAIYFTSDAQKKTAEEVKARVDLSGKWKNPIVTQIVKASEWTAAEKEHQDYLEKHPGGYTCHYMRE